jgi:hypothetical protein
MSLIVLINLHFPLQMDNLLSHLYSFNISSHTFQDLAKGSLYTELSDETVVTADGQNIQGKYILLKKSANFFGNQFTWMIVCLCLLLFAFLLRMARNHLKKGRKA